MSTFQQLSTVTGFAEQMVRICTAMDDDAAPEAKQVFAAIRLLGQSNIGTSNELNEAWRRLRRALLKSGKWTEFGAREGAAISHLLSHGSAPENAALLSAATIKATAIDDGDRSYSPESLAVMWRQAVGAQPSVLDAVAAISINGLADSVLDFIAEVREQPGIVQRIQTTRAESELETVLAADLSDVDVTNATGRPRLHCGIT